MDIWSRVHRARRISGRTRRLAAVALITLVTAVSQDGALERRPASAAQQRPNVLIIITDDQRAGLEVMPKTRRFFRRRGTTFSNGFTNTPLCCPARATIMTGQYPHNHGVKGNGSWTSLQTDDTLQHDFRQNGYRTAIFGKYLNHFPVHVHDPAGFDDHAIFQTDGHGAGYYRDAVWNMNGLVDTKSGYSTSIIRRKSVRFIRRNADRPWLMFVTVAAPHMPRTAEEKYARMGVGPWAGNPAVFERDRSDKPPWVTEHNNGIDEGRRIRRKQLRTLPSVDDLVGAVEEALADTGQTERTLAFFTTDNSYLWGEHGMAGKPSPYMQTIRVPYFARWPGRFAAGGVDTGLVGHVDMTATAYDAADVTPQHEIDGRSLLEDHARDRILVEMLSIHKAIPTWNSVVTVDGSHFIEYRDGSGVIYQELYDLSWDPWELTNVAPRLPDEVAALSALLATDSACHGTTCP